MKQFTKIELQENANRLMQHHNAVKIFATSDGNFFFQENSVINHNAALKKELQDDDLNYFVFVQPMHEEAAKVKADEEAAKVKADEEAAKVKADKETVKEKKDK
ncbi:MAG: hypothetical protein JSR11_03640 [Bacteroidetes bacterium]|nr:hypothetical protein [Bacteroidota bacterium]